MNTYQITLNYSDNQQLFYIVHDSATNVELLKATILGSIEDCTRVMVQPSDTVTETFSCDELCRFLGIHPRFNMDQHKFRTRIEEGDPRILDLFFDFLRDFVWVRNNRALRRSDLHPMFAVLLAMSPQSVTNVRVYILKDRTLMFGTSEDDEKYKDAVSRIDIDYQDSFITMEEQ